MSSDICTCDCHVIGIVQFDFVPCCEHCCVKFAKITAEKFIAGYCERSGITRAEYDTVFVCMPCVCNEPDCQGWATIGNDPGAIENQTKVYGPQTLDDEEG